MATYSAYKKYIIYFLILACSIVGALFLAELTLRALFPNAKGGIFVHFTNNTNVVDTKRIIQSHAGFNQNYSLFQVNPVYRKYGRYRKETQLLARHFTGHMNDDLMKIWNRNFLDSVFYSSQFYFNRVMLSGYQTDTIYAFTAPEKSPYPVYRYMSNATLPESTCRFNEYGFSGSELVRQKKQTIRLAFLGGSTTQQMAGYNFSYPDFIEAWLDKWAEGENLNIDFEVINAGRVALRSMDFRAIYEHEVKQLEPDMVIYYEGRNQFYLGDIAGYNHYGSMSASFVYNMVSKSVLLQLVADRLGIAPYNIFEKSGYKQPLTLPAFVFSAEPDLNINMPVNLNQICADLTAISRLVDTSKQVFLLNGFCMVTADSTLSKRNDIYGYWLHDYGRIPVKDITTLHQYENRVYNKWAQVNNVPYSDLVVQLQQHPELFIDGIHFSEEGTKMQAWAIFSALFPTVQAKIKSGQWPLAQSIPSSPPPMPDCYAINLQHTYGQSPYW